jgi:hypothetical protein
MTILWGRVLQTGQEIPRNVHNTPPLIPTLRQTNPLHTLTPRVYYVLCSTTFQATPTVSQPKPRTCFSLIRATFLVLLPTVRTMKLPVTQLCPAPVTCSLFSPNIPLCSLFSKTFSPRSSLDCISQVSHAHTYTHARARAQRACRYDESLQIFWISR